jgi:hypothetical protein
MELSIEPELYAPSIDDAGNYIDTIPHWTTIKHGIRCPCGSRKDKVFTAYSSFSAHLTTKTHQKWLAELNTNKKNYFVENEKLAKTVETQKIIIARLEKEMANLQLQINKNVMTVTKYKSCCKMCELD